MSCRANDTLLQRLLDSSAIKFILLRIQNRVLIQTGSATCVMCVKSSIKYVCLIETKHLVTFSEPGRIFRQHRMYEMWPIAINVVSASQSVSLSVCHECTKWPRTVKQTWDSASMCEVVQSLPNDFGLLFSFLPNPVTTYRITYNIVLRVQYSTFYISLCPRIIF